MNRDPLQEEGWDFEAPGLEWDPVEQARAEKAKAVCNCDEAAAFGWVFQCDRHHGCECYCLACV